MEMEYLAALKSSLREKLFPQSPCEEGCWTGAAAACVGAEDFVVDDLLDLSNENVEGEEEEEEERSPASAFSLDGTHLEESSPVDSGASPPAFSFPDGLGNVPTEELEELEWLSRFVDDSFSDIPPACNSFPVLRQPSPVKQEPHEASKRPAPLAFEAQLLARARSKRPRTGPRLRPCRSPTSSSSSSSSPSSCLIFANPDPNPDLLYCFKKPDPKKENRVMDRTGEPGQGAPRRCSHCLVQKTPQWRTGPLGSKTLCNACGVRYKSGRLLPEYRPAGSPTFLSHVHSNSHRKVLEMRRKKEPGVLLEPGTTAVPVQTF